VRPLAETLQRQESRQGLAQHQFSLHDGLSRPTSGRYVSLIAEGRFEEGISSPATQSAGKHLRPSLRSSCETACRVAYRSPHSSARSTLLTSGTGPIQASVDVMRDALAQAALKVAVSAATCGTLRGARPGLMAIPSRFLKRAGSCGMLYLASPNTVCRATWWSAGARNSRDRRHYSQAQSRRRRDFTVSELRHQASIRADRLGGIAAASHHSALIWMAFTRASTFSLT